MSRSNASTARGPGPVFLVGMMGVGKSTVGPLLAERLGLPFIDTDHEIERRASRRIPEIFAQDGENAFRALERETIDAVSKAPAIIALGGGAIAQPGAPERLRALGRIVYLHADATVLLARIGDAESRPLLAGAIGRGSDGLGSKPCSKSERMPMPRLSTVWMHRVRQSKWLRESSDALQGEGF